MFKYDLGKINFKFLFTIPSVINTIIPIKTSFPNIIYKKIAIRQKIII